MGYMFFLFPLRLLSGTRINLSSKETICSAYKTFRVNAMAWKLPSITLLRGEAGPGLGGTRGKAKLTTTLRGRLGEKLQWPPRATLTSVWVI